MLSHIYICDPTFVNVSQHLDVVPHLYMCHVKPKLGHVSGHVTGHVTSTKFIWLHIYKCKCHIYKYCTSLIFGTNGAQ